MLTMAWISLPGLALGLWRLTWSVQSPKRHLLSPYDVPPEVKSRKSLKDQEYSW